MNYRRLVAEPQMPLAWGLVCCQETSPISKRKFVFDFFA